MVCRKVRMGQKWRVGCSLMINARFSFQMLLLVRQGVRKCQCPSISPSSHIIFERDVEEASKAEQRSVVRFLTEGGVGGHEIHRRMERILRHLIEAQKITQIDASR